MLLVWLYGVMVVGAVSRSVVQISTEFDSVPLAYSLSAVAGVVYGFITYSLVRGGGDGPQGGAGVLRRRVLGVLTVGRGTLVEPSAFPDATVWSDYGMGYLFIPVMLPISAMYWLGRARGAGGMPPERVPAAVVGWCGPRGPYIGTAPRGSTRQAGMPCRKVARGLLQDDHRYTVRALVRSHGDVAHAAVQAQVPLAAVGGVEAEAGGAALLR